MDLGRISGLCKCRRRRRLILFILIIPIRYLHLRYRQRDVAAPIWRCKWVLRWQVMLLWHII